MTDTCELVGALEREWRDALCAKDMDRLRSLVHAKFTLIGTRAGAPFRLSRDEWLDAIQKRELLGIELDVREAAAFQDVIVGTIEARWRVSYLGRAVEDCVLLTDVWVRDQDRWQVVRRHSSPIPTTPEPVRRR
ncbi:nuclear transport factor 2 family protein [Sphingomonas sabuli]|uniref:Nuclear transport factor 2 family protein n=1 Tax=Sphingomonas sabuli TaxID=2764186 RepID=A0A7G9L1H8_9SPHN|nr:nuclear transport factor 2 family protein [Sphingomonas sabuli]QNM82477.1 nuclear transport factor 2 family protein [Sphingomonas sabuli]